MSNWTTLGEPIHAVYICAAVHTSLDGEDYWIGVSSGQPCVLYMIHMLTGRCVYEAALGNSHHTWGVVQASDGMIYMGGSANVFRFDPVSRQLDDLGQALEGETYLWRLAVGIPGRVYGGTYPGGKVWEWDIEKESFRDLGTVLDDHQYVRTLAVSGDKLYIGLGTRSARLVELDPVTGNKRDIPVPEPMQAESFLYDLDVRGGMLYIRFSPSNQFWKFDPAGDAWTYVTDSVTGLEISPVGEEGELYVGRTDGLYRYDPDEGTLRAIGKSLPRYMTCFTWVSGRLVDGKAEPVGEGEAARLLAGLHPDGMYWLLDPQTRESVTIDMKLRGQPIAVQSLTQDGKGSIYVGGYFAGGLGVYDSVKDELTEYRGIGQIEHMTFHDGKLYMGVYPKAHLYVYDPALPWDKESNPKHLTSFQNVSQDRSFGMTSAGDYVAVGTVPEYGKSGGGLFLYNPQTNEREDYCPLIPKQSVVTLHYREGVLYGGTSVWGGLGTPPTEKEGRLFAWHVERRELLWEFAPVSGERAVTAVTASSDGTLWGMTAGKLFVVDPQRAETLAVHELTPVDWSTFKHLWRNAFLHWHDDGCLYGTSMGKLFRFDPADSRFEILGEGVQLLAVDPGGRFYAGQGPNLLQFRPDVR